MQDISPILPNRWLVERNKSRNAGDSLARFVMEHLLKSYNEEFPLDLCYAIHDYSIKETWVIGITFVQNNLKRFPKEFVFSFEIEPPDHIFLLINNSKEEALYIKKCSKLKDGEMVYDNHYLIFDGNDYTIKKHEIKNWRLK